MFVMKNHESDELRWIVEPVSGALAPVMRSSDRPVMVTTVLASVANVWLSMLIVRVCPLAVRANAMQ